jgi:hypothetical protein
MEAVGIQVFLEEVGVALAVIGTVSGGEGVAETDDERTPVLEGSWGTLI